MIAEIELWNKSGNPLAEVTPTWVACTLIHAIPGRVRFRVPRLARDRPYADRLEQAIAGEPGVSQVRVNLTAASIAIYYQTQGVSDQRMRSQLVKVIQQTSQLQHSPGSEIKPVIPELPATEPESHDIILPAIATLLAILGGPLGWTIPRPVMVGSVAWAALPVAKRAIASLLVERRVNIDCLDLMAIVLSSLRGNLLTPALVMTLHEVGDTIRDRTARSSAARTADLMDTIGRFAWVERQGEKQQIPATDVEIGETVIVYPGEQIPVDGIVLQGTATIDRQKLTGESMPIVAQTGTHVYASTLLRSGELYIQAERVGAATRAAASLELVRKAPVHDTRMENYAANIADRAVLPAGIWAALIWALTRDPGRAAAILTLDFVTGIRVSVPTSFMAALTHATRHGILIRSGRALEQLAEVDTVVFDKTGTLTQGNLSVVRITTGSEAISEEEVLKLAAAAEQRISHPVAEAIVAEAQRRGVTLLPRGEWHYEVGFGIQAEIEGRSVLVGSDRFLRQSGITVDCLTDHERRCDRGLDCEESHCALNVNCSLIYVACEGTFQGVIEYADPLRLETPMVIQRLQSEYHIEVQMLTGDERPRAIAVAEKVGIPACHTHAEAFPEQKAALVRQLHESGKTVAFVGDGLNDSVALAYADVSVSFANGSDVARETADVVLMENDLSGLLDAIAIAKETQKIIQQNTTLVIGSNLGALVLASTLGLHPLAATVVHNGSAIAAGFNGLRPLMHVDPPRSASEKTEPKRS
ncbi:heavy metal translocating P-type ATPase [Phormidium pseudopriestleyi FRX01]|uniref:Heavy metal translocating P-type ATPase n=1 Tax=Phormidium pseudopriestleyi FRX01 TaxID=1759528 RepID=A0ABS3FMC4_9CYAN|nr:heavy metal translocating P-type ATPase [Phormidium pseudopriestleyi]MBO0348129.1 heavy metal translocating P-type ATPase [Phormidium pseudopriestleyi FRX01]